MASKPNKICENCHNECTFPCKALNMLYRVIDENDFKNKTEIINQYKKELSLIYAEPDEETEKLANQIISKFDDLDIIDNYDIKIGYVKSYERKTKGNRVVYADCRKLNEVMKAYMPFDFIITVYELNMSMLSENQKKIVIYHELKHIGVGPRGLRIEEHDIEDFDIIINKYGLHWDEFNIDVPDILE